MIRALAEVDKEFKDWKYICKSWPSECADMWREKEMELVEELNLQDKVIFIDDKAKHFEKLDFKKYPNLKTILYTGQDLSNLTNNVQ